MWSNFGLVSFANQSKSAVFKRCILLLGLGAVEIFPIQAKAQQSATAEELSHDCLEQVSQGNFQTAVLSCQTAISLTRAAGNARLEGYASGNLGTAYLHLQRYQSAVEQFQQARAIAAEADDPALAVRALVALGSAYLQMEQPESAIASYQEAVQLAEQSDYSTGIAIAAYNLGLAYDALHQPQRARHFYQQMLRTAQSISDPLLEGYAWSKLRPSQTAQR